MYLANYDHVHYYILRMLRYNRAEADDLTQDVFWVAYQKWDMLKDHENIRGFLILTAKNKIKKWVYKQTLLMIDEPEAIERQADAKGSKEYYGLVELHSSVEKILSKEELHILIQYYEYGYNTAEMAKKLGVTETCFKVRVMRMREKLKSHLERIVFIFVFLGVEITMLSKYI